MALKFHFIVIDSDLNETIRMLESIKNLVKEGCRVCIATTENYRELTKYADENKNYFISTSFNKDEDVYSLIDMAFKKMLTGYTVVLDNKDSITLDALNSIEQFINVKMKRLALVNNSPFVINNIIFKMLKGNKHYSFNDKIQELADMHSSTNMIYTWEDINETVNS